MSLNTDRLAGSRVTFHASQFRSFPQIRIVVYNSSLRSNNTRLTARLTSGPEAGMIASRKCAKQRSGKPMTVAVAMSGGVDSSVAAAILKREGHDVVGFTMQLWNQRRRLAPDEEPQPSRCCSLDDVYDARC